MRLTDRKVVLNKIECVVLEMESKDFGPCFRLPSVKEDWIELYATVCEEHTTRILDIEGNEPPQPYIIRHRVRMDGQFVLDCSKVILRAKNMWNANLVGGDFHGVDFTASNMENADIRGCNLTGANLDYVILRNAIAYKAKFTNARMYGTVIDGIKR